MFNACAFCVAPIAPTGNIFVGGTDPGDVAEGDKPTVKNTTVAKISMDQLSN